MSRTTHFLLVVLAICLLFLAVGCAPVTPIPTSDLKDVPVAELHLLKIQKGSFSISPNGKYGFFIDSENNHWGIKDGVANLWRKGDGEFAFQTSITDDGVASGIFRENNQLYGFWEKENRAIKTIRLSDNTHQFVATNNVLYNIDGQSLDFLPRFDAPSWEDGIAYDALNFSVSPKGNMLAATISLPGTTYIEVYAENQLLYSTEGSNFLPLWYGDTLFSGNYDPTYDASEVGVINVWSDDGSYVQMCHTYPIESYAVSSWTIDSGVLYIQTETSMVKCTHDQHGDQIEELDLPNQNVVGYIDNVLVLFDGNVYSFHNEK